MTANFDASWPIVCATCQKPVDPSRHVHLRFGEFWFHAECIPVCRACGEMVHADGECTWEYRAHVVSSKYGYDQHPTGFTCPDCVESTFHDEPSYLD